MRKFNLAEFKSYRKVTNNVQKRVKFSVRELQGSKSLSLSTKKVLKYKLLKTASMYSKHSHLAIKEKTLYFIIKNPVSFSSNRLDFTLFKSGVFSTVFQARNSIRKGFIIVDGFVVRYPMFLLKPGQALTFSLKKGGVPHLIYNKHGVSSNFVISTRFETSYSAGIFLLDFLSIKTNETKSNSF